MTHFILENFYNWLLILVRWVHIVVAISWIGESIFFMWLDRSLVRLQKPERKGHLGELWMVHGGGFYRVEKLLLGPNQIPRILHWFKWEAFSTWFSGMLLLGLIYYSGEGLFLIDNSISNLTFPQALLISLGSIFGSWFLYDSLWETRIVKEGLVGHVLTFLLLIALTLLLTHTLSGRAAYIHLAAIMGTWMVGNVLIRILPRQKLMIEATEKGRPVNPDWAINAKGRSTHNTYFTLPIIFIMISNHFPETYGHDLNWLLLLIISLGGACLRQYFILQASQSLKAKLFLIPVLVTLLFAFQITLESETQEKAKILNTIQEHSTDFSSSSWQGKKGVEQNKLLEHSGQLIPQVSSQNNRVIQGTVSYLGIPLAKKELRLPKACSKQHKGALYLDNIILNNSKLQNVFLHITQGLDQKNYNKELPKREVILDQKGCIYTPRVVAARVGQTVRFINSDPVFHNVKTITSYNQKFNKAMPKKGSSFTKIFTKPEVHIQTKCSLHPWMSAFIAVVDHPFYAITAKSGSFTIPNLPSGKYTLEAWHEVFGKLDFKIDLSSSKSENLEIIFK